MPTTALLDEKRLDAAVNEWAAKAGTEVQRRRKVYGWTQAQLADLSGVRHTTISKIERGELIPTDAVRLAIVSALVCEVVDIWPPLGRHFVMNVARTAQVAA